jgi:hypothetical protein
MGEGYGEIPESTHLKGEVMEDSIKMVFNEIGFRCGMWL